MNYETFNLNAFDRQVNGDVLNAIISSSLGVEGWAIADVGDLEAKIVPAAGMGECEVPTSSSASAHSTGAGIVSLGCPRPSISNIYVCMS